MRVLLFIAGALLLVIIGGGLTSILSTAESGADILPFLQQVASPDGSTMATTPDQSQLFFLFVGFILVNLIGIGLTIMLVMWFLNRGVRLAQVESSNETNLAKSENS